MLPFKIRGVVVCDDVRIENTGKHILIGVYLGTIAVFTLPTKLKLTFWMEMSAEQMGHYSGEMQIVRPDGSVIVKGGLKFSLDKKMSFIQLPNIPIEIQGYGPIDLQMKIGDDDWTTIRQIEVVPAPIASPSASAPHP